jgi:uncharacterized protein YcbK (DUF882 family)
MDSKFFKLEEFTCKCGCGLTNISPTLVSKLDKARGIADIPFVINSGCRCEKHNKMVGGSKSSSHLKGLAVDIKATTSTQRYKIINALLIAGFTRIGVAKTFIHVDIDQDKARNVIWTY